MQISLGIISCCKSFTDATKKLAISLGASFAIYCFVVVVSSCAFSQTVTTIHDFGFGVDGENPQSGVIFDRAGNILGSAALGGISGDGVIYKLTPSGDGFSWNETILHQFKGIPDGDTPDSILTMANSGLLFGTTQLGGARNMGSVFAVIPPTVPEDPANPARERVLYSFGSTATDGANPNTGLLPGSNGLYGVTFEGGANLRGTVFHLAPAANLADPWIETILHNFNGTDGAFPSSELVMDSKGNLYGTTLTGGAFDLGTVYRLTPPSQSSGAWTESVLFSFSGPDGSAPFGRLLLDGDGLLYGTTSGGGASLAGTVFRLEQSGDTWNQNVLYSFSGGSDGGSPEAGVIIDSQGRLFGTASTGGSGGPDFGGVVFVLTPPTTNGGSWTETVLHSFGGPDGFRPLCRLVPRNKALYGTTSAGGRNGTGTVFALTK